MAYDTLTVYAYGNVDALHGMFNAVAMIMSSQSFSDMIGIATIIGFATVATLAALPGNLQKGWNWFLSVAMISGIMLLPKANVAITDKLGQQATVVVSNVPWSLALMASVKSSIGASLTEMFETAFQTIPAAGMTLPSELSYLQHGMMFGSRLVTASRDAEAPSLYTHSDITQYIRNCVFLEQRTPAVTAYSDALTNTYADTNPAFSTSYHDPGANYALTTDTCDKVWPKLVPLLNAASADALQQLAAKTDRSGYKTDPTAAVANAAASLESIYAKSALSAAATSASEIMAQNILINATADAQQLYGAQVNDPSWLLMASMRTNATAQMNASNTVQGRIAEEALPLVRNVTEALLYACFPILCILLVASEGKALAGLLKSYMMVLVWVELWPPLFAVVNYLQTLELAKSLSAAAYQPGGSTALSLTTASAISGASVSALATTSWMVTFVPVIAAATLFGFDKIMAITGATGAAQKAASGEAASATKGNFQYGNVTLDQQKLDAYKSEPSMTTYAGIGGTEQRDLLTGQTISKYNNSAYPVTLEQASRVGQKFSESASISMASAERNNKMAEKSITAGYEAAQSALKGYGEQATRALGFDVSKTGSDGLSADEVNSVKQDLMTKHGIKDDESLSHALRAGIEGNVPVLNALGLKIGAGASSKAEEQEAIYKDIASSAAALRSKGLSRKQDVVEKFANSDDFKDARSSKTEATRAVKASLSQASNFKTAESADLTRAKELSTKRDAFVEKVRTGNTNMANSLEKFFQSKGQNVRNGVANPEVFEGLLVDFLERGSLVPVGGGKHEFIDVPQGFGPTIRNLDEVKALGADPEAGRAKLQAAFDAAAPLDGDSGVLAKSRQYDLLQDQARRQLGAKSANTTVSGAPVIEAVKLGQAAAEKKVADREAQINLDQGQVQTNFDSRADAALANPKYALTGGLVPSADAHRAWHNLNDGAGDARPFAGPANDLTAAAAKASHDLAAAVDKIPADPGYAVPRAADQIPADPGYPVPGAKVPTRGPK